MMVHGHIRRSKKDTSPKAKKLEADWEKLKNKWASQPKFGRPGQVKKEQPKPLPPIEQPATAMEVAFKKSFDASPALKKEPQTYSGEALGLATMHKSNTTLVYSKEAAIEIARMRR